jgi:hypothetical protein
MKEFRSFVEEREVAPKNLGDSLLVENLQENTMFNEIEEPAEEQ